MTVAACPKIFRLATSSASRESSITNSATDVASCVKLGWGTSAELSSAQPLSMSTELKQTIPCQDLINQEMIRGCLGDRRVEVSLKKNRINAQGFVTGGFRETDKVWHPSGICCRSL
jgi:hypothetical protein